MTFNSVETAALEACCIRAIDCPNAARRASRYAVRNSGSFIQRSSVLVPIPAVRAASSTLRWVSSAAIASSILRPNFTPDRAIRCQLTPREPNCGTVHRRSIAFLDFRQNSLAFPTHRSDPCRDRGDYRARRLQNDNQLALNAGWNEQMLGEQLAALRDEN